VVPTVPSHRRRGRKAVVRRLIEQIDGSAARNSKYETYANCPREPQSHSISAQKRTD
jgi:hypothetical protein